MTKKETSYETSWRFKEWRIVQMCKD